MSPPPGLKFPIASCTPRLTWNVSGIADGTLVMLLKKTIGRTCALLESVNVRSAPDSHAAPLLIVYLNATVMPGWLVMLTVVIQMSALVPLLVKLLAAGDQLFTASPATVTVSTPGLKFPSCDCTDMLTRKVTGITGSAALVMLLK